MEGITRTKVTEICLDFKMFHFEIVHGQSHAGRHWLAIPNWGVAANISDPANEDSFPDNARIIRGILIETNVTEVCLVDEACREIAAALFNSEMEAPEFV